MARVISRRLQPTASEMRQPILDAGRSAAGQSMTPDSSKGQNGKRRGGSTWCSNTVVFALNLLLMSVAICLFLVAAYEWVSQSSLWHLKREGAMNVADGGGRPIQSPMDSARLGNIGKESNWLSGTGGRKEKPGGVFQRLSQMHAAKNEAVIVDYAVAGKRIALDEALRPGRPWSPEENINFEQLEAQENKDIDEGKVVRKDVRLFVAVTATACSDLGRDRRRGIRETWMGDAQQLESRAQVKFFIGQSDGCNDTATSLLKKEIHDHGDIVIIREHDVYQNLFNKTHGILKYYLSHPANYTHILKTDDDVYVRVERVLSTLDQPPDGPYFKYVYKGCMESGQGFAPFRDPTSKWYQSVEEFDDAMADEVRGTHYLAGWGYILSRDVAFHAMKRYQGWEMRPETAPRWQHKFNNLEDIMVGILVSDYIKKPNSDYRFKASWRKCTKSTAVIHLDVDAPGFFQTLHEADRSGLWDQQTVSCSSGKFEPGDYHGWFAWRNSIVGDGQKLTW